MNDNIHIRPLDASEWEMFRDIRLKALKQHPALFSSTFQSESTEGDQYWQERLDQKNKCIFGLFDREKLIGVTGVFVDRNDPSQTTSFLGMSYILPEYRKRGLSKLLYKARVEWAANNPKLTELRTSHREDNDPSRHANQAFGFVLQGKDAKTWPDGTEAEEWKYKLDLDAIRKAGLPDPE